MLCPFHFKSSFSILLSLLISVCFLRDMVSSLEEQTYEVIWVTHCGKSLYLLGSSFSSLNLCPSPRGPKEQGPFPAWLGLSLCSDNQNIPAAAPHRSPGSWGPWPDTQSTQAGPDVRLGSRPSPPLLFLEPPQPTPWGDPSAGGWLQRSLSGLAPPLIPLLVQLHFLLWAPFRLGSPLSSRSCQDHL